MRLKKWVSLAMVLGLLLAVPGIAYGETNAYLIQSQDQVYQYDVPQLTNSFLGITDQALYNNFLAKLGAGGSFLSFKDSVTGKYVDYAEIETAFLNAGDSFNLNEFTENPNAPVAANLPTTVKNVVMSDSGEVTEETVALDNQGSYEVTVKPGLTAFDRVVEVKLPSDANPADYSVTCTVGEVTVNLQYVESFGVFKAVVTSTDENAIKAGITVTKTGTEPEEGDFEVVEII